MRADSALPSRKTQAVTFDLWETLLFDEREWDQRRKEIRSKRLLEALSRKGLSVPLQKIRDAYDQIVPWLTSFWNRNEEVPTIEQVKKIIEQIGNGSISAPVWVQNELDEAYSGPIDGDPFRINHDCIQTLHELRTRGYKLGLISNTGRTSAITQRRRMKDAGILDFFETTAFSNEEAGANLTDEYFQLQ